MIILQIILVTMRLLKEPSFPIQERYNRGDTIEGPSPPTCKEYHHGKCTLVTWPLGSRNLLKNVT